MTTATATATAWTRDLTGMHTRNPMPDRAPGWYTWEARNFTPAQHMQATCIHEAAHAALFHAAGITVLSAHIGEIQAGRGEYNVGHIIHGQFNAPFAQYVIAVAAGERAEDRWLNESRLWNTDRAWAAEHLAKTDRQKIQQAVQQVFATSLTYGTDPTQWSDLSYIHQQTDQAIDQHWDLIHTLADAFRTHRDLDADQITAITGPLPSPNA